MLASKCGAATIYATVLTIIFSLMNLMVYCILFGAEGLDCPLYAIEAYQDTPFGGTVGQFYLLLCVMKALGFSALSLFLLLLSVCFRRTLYPCILGIGVGVAASHLSGWAASPVWWKGILSAISPLTFTRVWDLWRNLCGDRLGSIYFPRFYMVLSIQLVLAMGVLWAVRRKSC